MTRENNGLVDEDHLEIFKAEETIQNSYEDCIDRHGLYTRAARRPLSNNKKPDPRLRWIPF